MDTPKKKYAKNDYRRNPTGKGGFLERPQDRNTTGRWRGEDSISFQYKMLIRLTQQEFSKWLKKYPKDKRTVAQQIAYRAVLAANYDIKYLTELTDRTEGKAPQKIEFDGEVKNIFDDKQVTRIAERIAGRKR